MNSIFKRDTALLELLVKKYGAETLKQEIKNFNKTKKIESDGRKR